MTIIVKYSTAEKMVWIIRLNHKEITILVILSQEPFWGRNTEINFYTVFLCCCFTRNRKKFELFSSLFTRTSTIRAKNCATRNVISFYSCQALMYDGCHPFARIAFSDDWIRSFLLRVYDDFHLKSFSPRCADVSTCHNDLEAENRNNAINIKAIRKTKMEIELENKFLSNLLQ